MLRQKFHGPSAVYRSFKAGKYPHLDKMKPRLRQGVLQLLATKPVRLGAWGDSASDLETIPILTQYKWTGYTHQWKANPQLKDVLMASVDSIEEYQEAKKQGWSCYRHTSSGAMLDTEIQCLFYTHGRVCKDCGLCNGNKSKAKDIITNTIWVLLEGGYFVSPPNTYPRPFPASNSLVCKKNPGEKSWPSCVPHPYKYKKTLLYYYMGGG